LGVNERTIDSMTKCNKILDDGYDQTDNFKRELQSDLCCVRLVIFDEGSMMGCKKACAVD
jgi:hypothetical protein